MKTFSLIRSEDVKTVSGTGRVAIGVDFENGAVALTWIVNAKCEGVGTLNIQTITFFNSVAEVQALHGHGQRTNVIMDQSLNAETVRLIQKRTQNVIMKLVA